MPRCFFPVWEGKPKQWGSLVTCSFLCALQPQHNRKRADLFPVPTASSRPQLGSPLCLPRYTHNSSPSFYTLARSPHFLPPVKGLCAGRAGAQCAARLGGLPATRLGMEEAGFWGSFLLPICCQGFGGRKPPIKMQLTLLLRCFSWCLTWMFSAATLVSCALSHLF